MRISIITVCYNSVETIERTIKSVISQNYEDTEYIVIDGGSVDGTVDIIKKYEKVISYWISEKDGGIYDAMNKGLTKATGEIIAFLNSDDWYENETLIKAYSYFNQYSPMILTGKVNIWQKEGWRKYVGALDNEKENIRIAMIYWQPATFARREVFEQFGGFDTQYRIAADYEWMLRLYDYGVEILWVEDAFTYYNSTGVSSSNMELAIKESRMIALKALEKSIGYNKMEKKRWRKKIIAWYDERKAIIEVKKIIRNKQIFNYPEMRSQILEYFTEQSYVVWGIGIIGEEVYNLLEQLGLDVELFIDENAENMGGIFYKRAVKLPEEIKNNKKVIVASLRYEIEIVEQLEEMRFQEEKDYILYSNILSKLTGTYREYYLNHEYWNHSICV